VVNGLAMTCKFPVWHSWEGSETATRAYGIWCKPAHTVHVVNNFNFNFNFNLRISIHKALCNPMIQIYYLSVLTQYVATLPQMGEK
jgi:hypothetical protein